MPGATAVEQGERSQELASSFSPGARGNRAVIYSFGGNTRRPRRWALYWEHWTWFGTLEELGHPPEGKSWGHRGQSVGGSAVGPVGMSTMEPESSAGNRRSDLCPLPGTAVTTLSVGPHCLRGCQLIFWSFKTRVISNSLQVREAYQCVLGVLLLLLRLRLLLERGGGFPNPQPSLWAASWLRREELGWLGRGSHVPAGGAKCRSSTPGVLPCVCLFGLADVKHTHTDSQPQGLCAEPTFNP